MNNFPPYLKILSFLLIILVSLLFTFLLGIVIAIPFFGTDVITQLSEMTDISNADSLSFLKYFQFINQIGLFIVPSLIFAFLVNRNISKYLKLNIKPLSFSMLAGFFMILLAMPVVSYLVEINEMLSLPDSFSGLENWMRESEDKAMELTEAFLDVGTISGLSVNLLIIAIIPALGEEFMFRGIFLRLFKEWTKNIHLAVIISAVLFSALHLQFYGFLPRMMLGIILGYLFVWSGSIWVPVLVHFTNNAAAVIASYLANRGIIDADLESFGSTDNINYLFGSIIIVLFLIIMIYKKEQANAMRITLNEKRE
ncbi:MAG: CPBP family intramembrane metalloprotease [Bacteroidales bacterium]|nr:CPBP family intramembrane metalloprotease [Bacteroidales bacterium]